MSDRNLRKQMVQERIQANRDLLAMEIETFKARIDSTVALVRAGRDVLRPLAAAAAGVNAALRGRGGTKGAAAGLAALVPVVLTVAKLVGGSRRSGAERTRSEATETATSE